MRPRVSVVVTAYNEGDGIVACLDRVLEAVTLPCEVLVVYDSPDDTTAPFVEEYAARDDRVVPTLNTCFAFGPTLTVVDLQARQRQHRAKGARA